MYNKNKREIKSTFTFLYGAAIFLALLMIHRQSHTFTGSACAHATETLINTAIHMHTHTDIGICALVIYYDRVTDCLPAWSFARMNGWMDSRALSTATSVNNNNNNNNKALWSHANVNKNGILYKFATKFNESRVPPFRLTSVCRLPRSPYLDDGPYLACLSLYREALDDFNASDLCTNIHISMYICMYKHWAAGIFTSLLHSIYSSLSCEHLFMTYKKLFIFEIAEAWVYLQIDMFAH